ncbi:class E sortase [Streptomyces sp. SP17BM10]|uniref:class E sortase n=1 Tax=Streptomyces sp. SP17BM10 TaxID=3002530 RepID=UPI002E7A5298|nr:class E sortase [Streptomyces sp. SP17BM10]MEE1787720.1 class E sortase [Streptomyces sp. SP17BM10]
MAQGRVVKVVAGGVGDALVTFGLLVVLLAVYSLWWSNVVSDREADRAAGRLRDSWSAAVPAAPPTPAAESPAPVAGLDRGALGFLHVPAMGRDNQVLIRPGTDDGTLAEGVAGMYTTPYGSVPPWEGAGNFALAAHRDGHGAKFHDLDRVGPGDALVVETRDRWYVYRVDGVLPETSPDDVGVIAPVPVGSPYHEPGRYITLTTCTPAYTSLYRLVVWGSLVREEAMAPGRVPPAELR